MDYDELVHDKSPKELTLRLLDRLGGEATFEEILYHVSVLQKIHRGLQDVEKGNVISHEEMRDKLNSD